MYFCIYFLIALLCFLINDSAKAEMFCSGLRTVVNEARNYFVPLRGNFDFYFDEYEGRVSFGELTYCFTESGEGVSEYYCQSDELPDDEDYANHFYENLENRLRSCFGDEIEEVWRSEFIVKFEHYENNDWIAVRMHRHKPKSGREPFYSVKIEVTAVDSSQ